MTDSARRPWAQAPGVLERAALPLLGIAIGIAVLVLVAVSGDIARWAVQAPDDEFWFRTAFGAAAAAFGLVAGLRAYRRMRLVLDAAVTAYALAVRF